MKGKNRRRIKRFFETPLSILGIVFTIGGVILAIVAVVLEWMWLLIVLFVILILIGTVLLYLYNKASVPEFPYFELVDFRTPDETTIREAVRSILGSQKAEPFHIHAAPKFKEISDICSRLEKIGFAKISGRPGEGKSMLAYQAAYSLQEEEHYSIYSLKTSDLEDKRWGEISDQIFYELDNLAGGKKLILIDDAHKLESRNDLEHIIRREAEESSCKCIWIETEEEYEESQEKGSIRINFQNFFEERLLEDLYKAKDSNLQEQLAGHIEGLEDAIKLAKSKQITDVWHFAFCATQGWDRLGSKISGLDIVELLSLFFISAHIVLSFESDLPERRVIDTIRGLAFNWLSEEKLSISDAIDNLWVKEKLIRVYVKSRHDRHIRALHRNFAREIIKASILEQSPYTGDLLISAKALLTNKRHLCVGYSVFQHDIGPCALQFNRDNKDWLVAFINNPLFNHLLVYAILLDSIKKGDSLLYSEIVSALDIGDLATTVSIAGSDQLAALGHLIRALGNRRDELIEQLDLTILAGEAKQAEINELEQVARVLKNLGDRKSQVSVLLDHDTFIQKASQAGPYDITGLTMLMAELEEDDRERYIRKVDWSYICIKCPVYLPLLSALGASLENLWKQAQSLSNESSLEKVAKHLGAHADKIKHEIARANRRRYSGVAKFLWNCNQVNHDLAEEIVIETIGKLAEKFTISPTEYQGTGRLINSVYDIDPNLSATFTTNDKVRGRIQQSINEHDWRDNAEELRHLVKAFYRSAPALWKKMVNFGWITTDLGCLDLDSIYRDVDAEKT